MKLAYIFIFIISVITVDKAAAEIIQVPQRCYDKQEFPCGVLIKYRTEELTLSGLRISAAAGSVLELRAEQEPHLIRGEFLISGNANSNDVYSLYGLVKVQDGSALMRVDDASVLVTNLSAQLFYQPRGEKKNYDLPKGFATSFSKVTKIGIAETAFPRPAEIDSLIASWAKFHTQKSVTVLRADLKDFLRDWTKATSVVRPWYEESVSREIASLREKERLQKEARERAEAANQVYRRMFRERVFNP